MFKKNKDPSIDYRAGKNLIFAIRVSFFGVYYVKIDISLLFVTALFDELFSEN
jgi:hypothetical protein